MSHRHLFLHVSVGPDNAWTSILNLCRYPPPARRWLLWELEVANDG
jgi:hypothetical protein